MSLNIGGDQADRSYRYKMPKLQAKVEGRGNGIKTAIPNMVDIAKALHVNPAYPTKFFGIELGAQSKFDKKTERAIVNGKHDAADLAKHLDNFIKMFVLCPTCGLPELKWTVKKSIKIDCAACGHNSDLPTNHRLVTYILKHPPSEKKSKSGDSTKDKKKSKKSSKRRDKGADADADANDDEESKQADGAGDVLAEPLKEKEVQWFSDTSAAAVEERRRQEFAEMGGAKGKTISDIVDGAEEEKDTPSTLLFRYVRQQDRSAAEVNSELRRLELAHSLDEPKILRVLIEGLIDTSQGAKTFGAQFKQHAELIKQVRELRSSSVHFTNAIEEFLASQPQGLVVVPIVLQALYDEDVLSEEEIVGWYELPPESSWLMKKELAAEARENAKPLIDWFNTADEESEEDD